MKKIFFIFVILISYNRLNANHDFFNFLPYISPGIQIGYGKSFFVSYQLSAGLLQKDSPVITGATIGKRFYRKNNSWDSYNYYDLQFSLFSLVGIGFGKLYNSDYSFNKYKLWTGLFGLLSYDYLKLNISKEALKPNSNMKYNPNTGKLYLSSLKHNFGIFGVFPVFDYHLLF
ncbi:MAG: hypothetical protein CMF96_05205 [Candidatus Marinimicrobia bacterium]|nr:hypothetical protein [Candidatus Neomarinimicrobiota bacterium]|tara:strand:- start:314 stop:832 length:519 start_codon:yes stop_codon:yes gene_type:complete